MKKKDCRKTQLFVMTVSSGLFLILFAGTIGAWTEPTSPPFTDPGMPTDSAGTVDTNCKCQTANLKKPGTSQGDWPQDSSSQTTLWNWWRNGETSWTKYGNATNTYNCHSYIFNSGNHWLDDPTNYIGSSSGCWKLDSSGTSRHNSSHSCTTGYKGKCGRMFLQDHNDDIYGTIANIYKKVD